MAGEKRIIGRDDREGASIPSRASVRQLAIGLLVLAALTVVGSFGYVVISDMSPLEALYMTVITLSTVGYDEVAPLSPAARLYTVVLIVLGIGTVFYVVVALASFLIEGRVQEILGRRNMKKAIAALQDHVIVCGFGRFGRAVSEHLRRAGTAVVVIEPNSLKEPECLALDCYFVQGSALDDAALEEAGIARSRALVAAIPGDSDNVFVTLSAREAKPGIRIHARADTPAGERRLRLSGANQVISPHRLGGQRIANAIVRPGVVEFLELSAPGDGAEVDLEEIALSRDSTLANSSVRDLASRGLHAAVIAIKRGDDPLRIQPGPAELLQAGDRIVVVGDHDNLRRLADLAAPPATAAHAETS
jgi:voltage-gated potassium channel